MTNNSDNGLTNTDEESRQKDQSGQAGGQSSKQDQEGQNESPGMGNIEPDDEFGAM